MDRFIYVLNTNNLKILDDMTYEQLTFVDDGVTCLMIMCKKYTHKHFKILKLLLTKLEYKDIIKQDFYGNTALHLLMVSINKDGDYREEAFDLIIDKIKITSLYKNIRNKGNTGNSVTIKNNSKTTILMLSFAAGDISTSLNICKKLINYIDDAEDIICMYDSKNSALQIALMNIENIDIIITIIEIFLPYYSFNIFNLINITKIKFNSNHLNQIIEYFDGYENMVSVLK